MAASTKTDDRWGDSKLEIASPSDPSIKAYSEDLVLAWARDRATGEPRYIGELRPEQTGRKCGCDCYSCGLELEAINAGRLTWRRRPHFRHPKGAVKDDCIVLAARAAALEMLKNEGTLLLPKRRRSSEVEGLSGDFYEAWVESPAQRVHVADFKVCDKVSALLTLDDGRQLRVLLVGSLDAERPEDGEALVTPTIRLIVDDPAIASMSPEEIRHRLTVIVDGALWCSHWNDAQLAIQAIEAAQAKALNALDWLNEGDFDFPDGTSADLKRETLLHLKAKEILERERRIKLPALCIQASAELHDGDLATRNNALPEQTIELESVALEKRIGQIRPDVVAKMRSMVGWHADDLLVEITVTNAISEERLARIRAENRPTVEIDLSRMGGRVTEDEFTKLIVDEVAGKQWLHHPWMEMEQARLEEAVRIDVEKDVQRHAEEVKAQEQREKLRRLSLDDLCAGYLDAIRIHGNLRAQSPSISDQRIEDALERVRAYAAALAAQGYPEAQDEFLFVQRGNVIERILSMKLDMAVGYSLDTAWQVINAILQERARSAKWQTLYLTAIKAYKPTLNELQAARVEEWRQSVWNSLKDGKDEFRRDRKYDRLLSLLFRELAPALQKPLPGDTPRSNNMTAGVAKANSSGAWRWKSGHVWIDNDKWLPQWREIVQFGIDLRDSGWPATVALQECAQKHPEAAGLVANAWMESSLAEPVPVGESDFWLRGRALEAWKARHPEAAARWFGSGKEKP